MSVADPVFDRELREALGAVDQADAALRGRIDRLREHARRPASYAAPMAAVGGLVAFRLVRRMFRRSRRSVASSAGGPAKAGLAALLLRLSLPAVVGFAREQAGSGPRGVPPDRSGLAGSGAGAAAARAGPMPRVSGSLDRGRFAGRWFEVASLDGPRDAPAPNRRGVGDGTVAAMPSLVFVPVPDGFDVEQSTPVADARGGSRMHTRRGVLRPTDPSGRASQLSLSWAPAWARWLPMAWSDYWVLDIDAGYTFALIGDRDRTALRVLSRTPVIDEDAFAQLLRTAIEEGYPVQHLRRAISVGGSAG
jgi:apolipoprotein D and lipocalin family protein